MNTAYADLERRFARIAAVEDALGILGWDSQTMMPDGAASARSEQVATLKVMAHEVITAPDLGDRLADAEAGPEDDPWRRANMREMRRRWIHETAVPADLVEANSKATSACEMVWRTARPAADFKALLPHLREVLNLQRQIARAKAERLGTTPYDALVDLFDPGGRAARIDVMFDDLAAFLPGFTDAVLAHQAAQPPVVEPQGPFAVETQRALCVELMKAVGFDFGRGRLDVSLHPFCGGAAGDIRITTRYREDGFTSALMGVLHETGHAMYELNRPADWLRQPVGKARGMSVHESQSLIVEMQACRSPQFLRYAAPLLRRAFGGDGPAWEADNLYRLYTRVRRDFIRVDADEVTYPAHVILRYRLERAMIGGTLEVEDLPSAWADGLRDILGIVPPDDRLGCLQDIHWPAGLFGYFPSYTLGAMTAAQLFDAARRSDGGLESAIGQGDFRPLMEWLKANVHQWGSLYGTDELLTRATGRPLDAAVYKAHLKRRYLGDAE